ncbi:MAG: hypothetical protein AUK34_07245 [Ignavibacteria bacterium CG2_30_36_16]|nr:MAG: hypothetical protein AUK34_07245 [Ignavibacteria bacterium CG2_30_36_16]PJB01902.1 MAG: hypothetical protein CO127_01405 [Ignavibacteria bacterium CG_4_9_14_3_um_filter_36_18]
MLSDYFSLVYEKLRGLDFILFEVQQSNNVALSGYNASLLFVYFLQTNSITNFLCMIFFRSFLLLNF